MPLTLQVESLWKGGVCVCVCVCVCMWWGGGVDIQLTVYFPGYGLNGTITEYYTVGYFQWHSVCTHVENQLKVTNSTVVTYCTGPSFLRVQSCRESFINSLLIKSIQFTFYFGGICRVGTTGTSVMDIFYKPPKCSRLMLHVFIWS